LLALTLTTVALLMSDPTSQEPTMEEILASIRRIISEDEVPAEEGAEEVEPQPEAESEPDYEPMEEAFDEPEPEPEPEPAPAPVLDDEDDILDLTEPYKAPAPVFQSDDLEAYAPPPPPTAAPAPAPMMVIEEAIVSHVAEVAAASAFGHLAQTIAMPGHGRTLEDVVRELLRPMLKTWLDENLPTIVQATVDEEVSRISRRRL
jgi:cell pole-organizing protein PopZ